jgi:tetratricopeptide (TPR) repeat protein
LKAAGDSEKAMQLFQQSLDIFKETTSISPKVAEVYEHISAVKFGQGLLDDAIAASAEALKIRRRTLGDDHADTKRRMEIHRSLLKQLLENRS